MRPSNQQLTTVITLFASPLLLCLLHKHQGLVQWKTLSLSHDGPNSLWPVVIIRWGEGINYGNHSLNNNYYIIIIIIFPLIKEL